MTVILSIQGLKKRLGGREVLADVTLDVRSGEIVAVVGPSGSGKSTLLRCLNRLLEVDGGTIGFNGRDITTMDPIRLRRRIVLVHQESVMFPGTVYENIAYGLQHIGSVDSKHIRRCIRDAGLSDRFLQRTADQLSMGEKKRVALARSLALRPEILLLDEPTAGVDPRNVERVEASIIRFTRDRQLTVLWVTHDVAQATRVSDRVANLKEGIIKTIQQTVDFPWREAY